MLFRSIKRSGPLEVGLALEITKQAAAGLAAVHKKKLVHRDIKPSNIMVSFEDEGAVSVKIIDLGLAKWSMKPLHKRRSRRVGPLPEHQSSPVRNKSSEERWISVRISTSLVFRSGRC